MNIYQYFANMKRQANILEYDKIKLGQATDGYNQMLILSDFYSGSKSIFVVLPTLYSAQKYYDVICRNKERFFNRKIGLYLGLGTRSSIMTFFKFWKSRKEKNLNGDVFKYALLVAVKTQK